MPDALDPKEYIKQRALALGVPVPLALGVADQESRFSPGTNDGPEFDEAPGRKTRAIGLFQVTPSTAARFGGPDPRKPLDPRNPTDNVEIGLRYLKELHDRYQGNPDQILKAYGGVRTNPDYIPQTMARVLRYQAEQGGAGATPQPTASDTPQPTTPPPEPPGILDKATGALDQFRGELHSLDLKGLNNAVQQLFWDPVHSVPKMARGYVQSMQDVGQRFTDAVKSGDVVRAGLEGKNWLLSPLGIGQRLSEAEQHGREGDVPRMLGASVDTGLSAVGPEVVGAGVRAAKVLPQLAGRNLPAVKQAAVRFALDNGIPVDLATATGNQWLRSIQAKLENTPLGSVVRGRVERQRGTLLPELEAELAQRTHPASVTPQAAGEGVTQAIEGRIRGRNQMADRNYDRMRAIADDPRNRVTVQTGTRPPTAAVPGATATPVMQDLQLPVDRRAAKAALRPIYEQKLRTMPLTQQQSNPGLLALRNIVDGPDWESAVITEQDLSALKAASRGAKMPELRTGSQGLAARAVDALSTDIDTAFANAPYRGTDARRALQAGRLATRRKWITEDVLDQLFPGQPERREMSSAFTQATAANDSHITQLRRLAQEAPGEMPKVGRAVLDQMMHMATAEGGFNRAARLWADWQKVGPDTRNILFGGAHAADLDKFFLAAKMLAEHPNPSRSGLLLSAGLGGGGGALASYLLGPEAAMIGLGAGAAGSGVLAKMLNSPRVTRLLTQGLTMDPRTAAGALWLNTVRQEAAKAGESEGGPPAPPPPQAGASPP